MMGAPVVVALGAPNPVKFGLWRALGGKETTMADNPVERDFEKPIIELEKRIEELESFSRKAGVDLSGEIAKLRERANQEKREIFARLNAWQRVLLSRDPGRPDVMDYLNLVFEDFVELHGD